MELMVIELLHIVNHIVQFLDIMQIILHLHAKQLVLQDLDKIKQECALKLVQIKILFYNHNMVILLADIALLHALEVIMLIIKQIGNVF